MREPIPVQPVLTVDALGRVRRDGTATLSGPLTCSANFYFLSVSVTQVVGRGIALSAYGGVPYEQQPGCDGTPQPRTVEVTPWTEDSLRAGAEGLRTGPASMEAYLQECADLCGIDHVSRSVVLRAAPR